MKILIVTIALLVQLSFAAISHEGEQIWKVSAVGEDRQIIKDLAAELNLDVWSVQVSNVDIAVIPRLQRIMKLRLQELGFTYKVMIANLQTLINEQQEIRAQRESVEPSVVIDTGVYHDLDSIYSYIDELASTFDYITVETIGYTIESREVKMLKLSTNANNENAYWIQCGIHAREWVSPATCIYGLDHLTQNYGVDSDVTTFMDAHDIYMVVVVNPDGYSYTWTDDRMWRKNRRVNTGSSCMGVDLNRNYNGYGSFGLGGSSSNPCSETYHGLSGFSEPETALLRDRIELIQQTQTITAFYDNHSYSQLWLIPLGYTAENPINYDAQFNAASVASDALSELYGTAYTPGSAAVVIYQASGIAVDWSSSVGIAFSYTPELRDTGEFGFLLPEDQIIPTAEEYWTGLFAAYFNVETLAK